MADEATLLERIHRGDREAVALCIDRYSGLVWSLANRFIANPADAEEAVQDIFMELWSKAGRFDPGRAAEVTFVSMLARRRLIDHIRRQRREPAREALDSVAHTLSEDGHRALEASADTRRVLEVIGTLQPEQQQVIHMASWLGMSHGAIAEQTGMPLGSVKSYLRRGLQRVRETLGKTTHAPDGATT